MKPLEGKGLPYGEGDPRAVLRRIEGPMQAVEAMLRDILSTDDPFLKPVLDHLARGGGKRLRPALFLLSVEACQGDPYEFVSVAAALECVHMASLVHDDVIDEADRRRGLPTVHRLWGTKAGVLAGDYLFARAFSILAREGGPRVVERMAQVISDLASGELRQQNSLYRLDQSEEEYFQRIHQKTASFLGECCRIAGIVTGQGEETQDALYRFGQRVGMGFQVIDDILDLIGDSQTLGKPAASDLAAGILTLPVIYGLQDGELGPRLREYLQDPPWGRARVEEARQLLLASDAIGYTYRRAREFTEEGREALASLPPGEARDTLEDLARILLLRSL